MRPSIILNPYCEQIRAVVQTHHANNVRDLPELELMLNKLLRELG